MIDLPHHMDQSLDDYTYVVQVASSRQTYSWPLSCIFFRKCGGIYFFGAGAAG